MSSVLPLTPASSRPARAGRARAASRALHPRQGMGTRDAGRPVARLLARRARATRRSAARDGASLCRATAPKRVAYLSIEYLLGRVLGSALANMGCLEPWRAALAELGLTLEDVEAQEPEPAVGNGGLGRLAACFLDSLATHGYPALRLRHQLRVRPVQAGHRRRLAARAARSLDGRSLPLADRARRRRLHRAAVRPHRARARRRRALQPAMGGHADPDGRALGSARRRLRDADRECAAAVHRAARPTSSTWPSSTPATTSAPSSGRCCRRRSRRCSTRPTPCGAAASCAWCRSTSSWPARSATSCAATTRRSARSTTSPTRSPSR